MNKNGTESLSKLLRVVIPSWKFFDELSDVARLYYRWGLESAELGPWILYTHHPRRTLGTLFLNPEENLYLANIRLIADLPSSARLVEKLVEWEIRKTQREKIRFQYQSGEFTSKIHESLAR